MNRNLVRNIFKCDFLLFKFKCSHRTCHVTKRNFRKQDCTGLHLCSVINVYLYCTAPMFDNQLVSVLYCTNILYSTCICTVLHLCSIINVYLYCIVLIFDIQHVSVLYCTNIWYSTCICTVLHLCSIINVYLYCTVPIFDIQRVSVLHCTNIW